MRKLKPDIQLAAKELQLLVRAEAGASSEPELCVVHGVVTTKHSPVYWCRCVTCGALLPWKSASAIGNHMHGGHYLRGRTGAKSVMLKEMNVHPQCGGCNAGINSTDVQANYHAYMLARYGQEKVDELVLTKNVKGPPSHEEIVRLRHDFRERIKAAERAML